MQSVSSRIWTRVAVSISYDDNHYTTGTSKIVIGALATQLNGFMYRYQTLIVLFVTIKWFQV